MPELHDPARRFKQLQLRSHCNGSSVVTWAGEVERQRSILRERFGSTSPELQRADLETVRTLCSGASTDASDGDHQTALSKLALADSLTEGWIAGYYHDDLRHLLGVRMLVLQQLTQYQLYCLVLPGTA